MSFDPNANDPDAAKNSDTPQAFPPVPPAYPPQVPTGYAQPAAAYGQTPAQSMETPVKVLGICYLILAVLAILVALFVGFAFGMIASQAAVQNPGAPAIPAAFGPIFAILIGLFGGLLPMITGIGLLRRASWGRVMAIVNGILILISIPVGTILGGITLYFMLRGGASEGYAQLSRGTNG